MPLMIEVDKLGIGKLRLGADGRLTRVDAFRGKPQHLARSLSGFA
jgi:hypothetical protein